MLDEFEISPQDLKEQDIQETAHTLNMVNYQIAELVTIKEELELRLRALLEHGDDDAQKTYKHGRYKITLSAGYIYSLNKEQYELNGDEIPDNFNPVKKKMVYEIDKRILKDIDYYCDEEQQELIYGFISKKPKKLHVRITDGV